MKNIKNIVAICLAALAFSCTDNETSLNLNGDVDIHSFAVNGVEGVINAQTSSITVILPFGTDLTNLAPEITIGDGASITPASGQAIDFSQSALPGGAVTYTVSNGDVYQTYKVAVDVARAKITAFRIGAVEAFSIDEENRTIDIYLPVGTDVSALAPTIEYTEGATITPAAGAQVDFTNPVQYTLVYEGSAFVYTVTVHLGEPPISEIVIYNGEDVAPIWTGIAAFVESPFANPKTGGINPSPYCASIVRNSADTDDGGKPWSGGALWNAFKVNIDPAKYGSFSLMVLKEVAGDVQLEIQRDGEQDKDWLKVWYGNNLGEWQELIFTIPEGRAVINNILVAPHCHDAGQPTSWTTHRMYWDNLKAIPR